MVPQIFIDTVNVESPVKIKCKPPPKRVKYRSGVNLLFTFLF